MRRAVLVLSAATVAVMSLAACSGGSGGGAAAGAPVVHAVDALALVKRADTAGAALRSAHLQSTTTLAGKTTTIDGDISYRPVALQETVHVGATTVREVLVGHTFYLQIPHSGLGSKPWVTISVARMSKLIGIDLGALLNNNKPTQTVQLLTQSGDLKAVGTDTVEGVSTQHLAGTVDLARAMQSMSASSPAYSAIESMVKSAGISDTHIDLWVNAQDIPVKFIESYSSKLGPGTTTMTLSKIDQPVHIVAPPAGQTQEFPG